MKLEDLLERTHFYKGCDTPPAMGNMVGLYWDYERVWVEQELNPEDFYKETVAYFQRTFKGKHIRTDVPIGLQAIFANRLEHWGNCQVTYESLSRFIDDYLKTASVYEKEV